jgi:hypothetical protein
MLAHHDVCNRISKLHLFKHGRHGSIKKSLECECQFNARLYESSFTAIGLLVRELDCYMVVAFILKMLQEKMLNGRQLAEVQQQHSVVGAPIFFFL